MSETSNPTDENSTVDGGLIQWDINKAAIAEVAKDLKDIDAYKDLDDAKAAKRQLIGMRTELTEYHKDTKAKALAFGKECDSKKNEYMALIREIEDPISIQLDEIKNAAAKKEEERVAKITAEMERIQAYSLDRHSLTLEELEERLTNLSDQVLDPELLEEYIEDAQLAKDESDLKLRLAIDREKQEQEEREKNERVEAENKELREKLEKAEAEQAERDAAAERDSNRIHIIKIRIEMMRDMGFDCSIKPLSEHLHEQSLERLYEIQKTINEVDLTDPNRPPFEEFLTEAEGAKTEAQSRICIAIDQEEREKKDRENREEQERIIREVQAENELIDKEEADSRQKELDEQQEKIDAEKREIWDAERKKAEAEAEEERKAEEQKLRDLQAPDIEKLKKYGDAIDHLIGLKPVMGSTAGNAMLLEVTAKLIDATDYIHHNIEELT